MVSLTVSMRTSSFMIKLLRCRAQGIMIFRPMRRQTAPVGFKFYTASAQLRSSKPAINSAMGMMANIRAA
jgi:hypothetical protein